MRLPTLRTDSTCRPTSSLRAKPSNSRRVPFTVRTVPSSAKETKPHGARSSSGSILLLSSVTRRHRFEASPASRGPLDVWYGGEQIFPDHVDGLVRVAHMRTVTGRPKEFQRTPRNRFAEVLSDLRWGDDVLRALHDERRHSHSGEVLAV